MDRVIKSVIVLVTLVSLAACVFPLDQAKVATTPNADVPLYPKAKRIDVSDENVTKYISNTLGAEYLRFPSRTDFYWTKDPASNIAITMNKSLSEAGWKVETDWGYPFQNLLILSIWKKGGFELSIILLDDMDKIAIEGLSKNYGIFGPVPGSTLVVQHVMDKDVQR